MKKAIQKSSLLLALIMLFASLNISAGAVSKKLYPKLSTTKYTYKDETFTPSVSVKTSDGVKLKLNKDYTVSYAKGRTNVGKYAVKIKYKGKYKNYSGKDVLYFTIAPKTSALSKLTPGKKSLTVTWKKQTDNVTGYQIQYSNNRDFSFSEYLTVKSNKKTSATLKKLKSSKPYYVRIRTYKTYNGEKIYSKWSKTLSKRAYTIPSDAFKYKGHYYMVYSDVCDTWEDAKNYCKKLGGHLATISSSSENYAVYEYMISTGYNEAYFGYSDAKSEGNWEWVSGNSSYTNWQEGEPNNENTENYAQFWKDFHNSKWNDNDFDYRTFICEWG